MLPVLLSRSTSDDPFRWRWRDLPLRVKGIIVLSPQSCTAAARTSAARQGIPRSFCSI